jgi:hypothetical protein
VSASEDVEVDGAKALLYRDAPSWEGLPTAAIGAFACADAKRCCATKVSRR